MWCSSRAWASTVPRKHLLMLDLRWLEIDHLLTYFSSTWQSNQKRGGSIHQSTVWADLLVNWSSHNSDCTCTRLLEWGVGFCLLITVCCCQSPSDCFMWCKWVLSSLQTLLVSLSVRMLVFFGYGHAPGEIIFKASHYVLFNLCHQSFQKNKFYLIILHFQENHRCVKERKMRAKRERWSNINFDN